MTDPQPDRAMTQFKVVDPVTRDPETRFHLCPIFLTSLANFSVTNNTSNKTVTYINIQPIDNNSRMWTWSVLWSAVMTPLYIHETTRPRSEERHLHFTRYCGDTIIQVRRKTHNRVAYTAYVHFPQNSVYENYVIVRPLSTVEYTSVASLFHCRQLSD